MSTTPPVAGLSEGVEFVKFGLAGDEDFEIVDGIIYKGKRQGAASGVLVKPAPGYVFRPLKTFDIRNYVLVDGLPNQFMAVQQFPPLEMNVQTKFTVNNSFDRDVLVAIQGALNGLKFGD